MTLPAWPLPEIGIMDRTRGTARDARRVFEPDQGGAIMRPAVTAQTEAWAIVLQPMTATELAVFEDWMRDTLGMGALAFAWTHPVSGDARVFQIAAGEQSHAVEMLGGSMFEVTFSALVLPGPVPA